MKQLIASKPFLIGAVLVAVSALSFGWYAQGLSQRRHTLDQLQAEVTEASQRPSREALLNEVADLDRALDALRDNVTATHLRHCSQAMDDAGLTGRSVTTHEPQYRDGLVLTAIRFRAHGSVDAVFAVLRSDPFSRDGVLVERFAMALPDNDTTDGLCFELDMVLVRPE